MSELKRYWVWNDKLHEGSGKEVTPFLKDRTVDVFLASEAEAEIKKSIDAVIQWMRDNVTEIGCVAPKESDYIELEKYIRAVLDKQEVKSAVE